MDEIGNHLYIIIFVGIIIFNILKALRKRPEPVPAPNFPENHPYSTNEEDDFWGNPVFHREPMTHQPLIHQPMQSPSKAEPSSKRKQSHLLNEKEENKNISVSFNNTDDARQAFIYSEIWNRKY